MTLANVLWPIPAGVETFAKKLLACPVDLLLRWSTVAAQLRGPVQVGVVPQHAGSKTWQSSSLLHGEARRAAEVSGETYSWASCGQVSPTDGGAWDRHIEIFYGRSNVQPRLMGRTAVVLSTGRCVVPTVFCSAFATAISAAVSLCQLTGHACAAVPILIFCAHDARVLAMDTKRRNPWLQSFRKLHSRPAT